MKQLNPTYLIWGAIKRFALALAVVLAVVFGVSQAARAATITYTFPDLGDPAVLNKEGWTSVFPGNGEIWANYDGWFGGGTPVDDGHLGDGWDTMETQLAHSPAFKLDGSGDMTMQMLGTPSPASAPTSLTSAGIGATAIVTNGFMGVALRDVATDTYVLWSAWPGSTFAPAAFAPVTFTVAQLSPYANDGRAYTLDFIDNDKGLPPPLDGDHWVTLGGATIPGVLWNDNFADAINLPGSSGIRTGSGNHNATFESGEPVCVYNDTTHTVWFKWTCPTNGTFTIGTLGSTDYNDNSEWDAIIGCFTGTAVGSLTQVVAPTDTGYEETLSNIPVTAGTTYYFQLGGDSGNTEAANILLTYALTPTPSVPPIVLSPDVPVTSGLVLDMDASQIANGTNGLQLGTWPDASGLGNNAVRQSGSSAGYPMYVTNVLNGQPVVRFNSANGNTGDYFQFTRISTIRTVFWVLKDTQVNGTHFLLGDSGSYQFHRGYGGNAGKLWDGTYAADNIRNGTTKLMGNAINGTTTSLPSASFQVVSLVTTGNVEANQICQDRTYNGSWEGDIAEIVIYNRALTVSEENQVGFYLATKYGLSTAYTAPPAAPSDALIHYNLDGVNGTTVTNTGSLGSAADGVLQSGSVVAGKFDNALSFSGTGSGFTTANNVSIGNAFTFACWVSTTSGNGGYHRIIHNSYGNSGYLGTDGGGAYLTIAANNFDASATSPDTSGAWHHLVFTWDGTTQNFYYDGVINKTTVPSARNTTFNGQIGFGSNPNGGEAWNGKMDDAYVFGRALSATEVENLYVNYVNTAPSTNKDIVTFQSSTISGTNITMSVAYGTSITNIAPTYTVSAGATGSPASGTARNFTTPQTYTITAQDASTKDYRVTVNVRADSRPPVTSGLIVWLAADRVNLTDTTQTRVSGADTFIKQWNDGSGNANNATQATTGSQPKYIDSGLNGQPVVRFVEATGNTLELGDLSASFPTAASMFAVATINADGRYNLFDNRNNDSRWVANTWTEGNPGVFRNDRQGMSYSAWPQSGSHVFSMESGSGVYRFLTNGGTLGSNAGSSYHNGNGQNWTIGDRPGGGQQLNGDIPEFLLYNRILTTDEANAVGAYLAAKYGLPTTYSALPAPTVPTGVTVSPVSASSLSVSWAGGTNAQSYFVSVSNTVTTAVQILPVVASPYTVTGLTGNTRYEFAVQATNFTGASAYSAAVSGTPSVSTAKDILTFVFPGQPDTIISGANISVTMPVGTPVTALAPTHTISFLATSSPVSGTVRDFTSPQTYTITAEDLSTQDYTVTVTLGAVATNFTWTTGSGGNWSDSTKWVNDLANGIRPVTSGQPYYTLNFNQAVTAVNDLSTNFLLNQLNFGAAVTIPVGNSIRLTNNGATLPAINQNSASGVAISAPLSLAAGVTMGGSSSGDVTLNGVVSGVGSLTKVNGGTLTLGTANTYSGGTTISNGTLSVGNRTALGSGTVTLAGGSTMQTVNFEGFLHDGNPGNLANDFVLSGGLVNLYLAFNATKDMLITGVVSGPGGFRLQGFLRGVNLTGNNTFSGGVTLDDGPIGVTASHVNGFGVGPLSIGSGASANLAYTGDHVVTALTLNGVVQPKGTYGSSSSPATTVDSHFSGTGTVTVPNRPPVAVTDTFTRSTGISLKISKAALLANDTDADLDTLTFVSFSSTNGTVSSDATTIYVPANTVNESFTYMVRDNFGGTNTGTVNIVINNNVFGQTSPSIDTTGGNPTLHFAGIPGYRYSVERCINVDFTGTVDQILTTNAPAGGLFQYTDTNPPMPAAYYRLRYNP